MARLSVLIGGRCSDVERLRHGQFPFFRRARANATTAAIAMTALTTVMIAWRSITSPPIRACSGAAHAACAATHSHRCYRESRSPVHAPRTDIPQPASSAILPAACREACRCYRAPGSRSPSPRSSPSCAPPACLGSLAQPLERYAVALDRIAQAAPFVTQIPAVRAQVPSGQSDPASYASLFLAFVIQSSRNAASARRADARSPHGARGNRLVAYSSEGNR